MFIQDSGLWQRSRILLSIRIYVSGTSRPVIESRVVSCREQTGFTNTTLFPVGSYVHAYVCVCVTGRSVGSLCLSFIHLKNTWSHQSFEMIIRDLNTKRPSENRGKRTNEFQVMHLNRSGGSTTTLNMTDAASKPLRTGCLTETVSSYTYR